MPKKTPHSVNNSLLDFMAKACSYAQAHVGDPDAWPKDKKDREHYLQCVSFQMACFLAQNTWLGQNGVEWSVVIEELICNRKNKDGFMIKSIDQWKKILGKHVQELGGWKID